VAVADRALRARVWAAVWRTSPIDGPPRGGEVGIPR